MSFTPFNKEDRQWDARFNVPNNVYLDKIINNCKKLAEDNRLNYCLVGGIETGTKPQQDDYQREHVHCAFIFKNRISKRSILRNLEIIEGYGYYLVPRNRELPYQGWREHHTKPFSKNEPETPVLFEYGELPTYENIMKKRGASELEKKRKIDEILLEMRDDLENGKDKECFEKFPRNFIMYGEKIKAMICQKRDFFKTQHHPNIWLYGLPGSGKTSILQFVYPNSYKKNLYNKFFDLYDPKTQDHIILEDLDHEAVERLSINFLKTLCDPQGFPVDQKYKTPQPAVCSVLVTSNFTIPDIIPDGKGIEENKAALLRRFWHIRVDNLMKLLNLKLIPKWDQKKLKREGNADYGKLFIAYDYMTDTPLCQPIKSPEEYQKIIKDYYYSCSE